MRSDNVGESKKFSITWTPDDLGIPASGVSRQWDGASSTNMALYQVDKHKHEINNSMYLL